VNNSGTLVDRRLEAGDENKVAIRCAGETVTYAQLHDRICRVGNVLEGLGVGREDRVLMILDDSPTFAALFLGAMRAGAVPAPVSFLDTTDNFAHYARDSYAKVIVAEDALLERLPEGAMARSQFESLMADSPGDRTPADTHRDDMAFWLFSGGSTGFPKGVVHLHHDIEVTCESYAGQVLGLTEDDITFSTTKLFHAYGLGNGLSFPLWFGATSVLMRGPTRPEPILATLREHRPTVFFSVPALFAALVRDEAAGDAMGSVRFCVSAAEALPPQTVDRWKQRFGVDIIDGIGSTEMLHIFCSNRPGAIEPGTTGRPVRGDSCAAFYWHQHEKTKRCMRGDWFATGDRYERREDGAYAYVGRMDDMLKIGGLWVSPIDMEHALVAHPRVRSAGVVGVEVDDATRIAAYVECEDGETGDEALADELRAWCKERLRRYEYPYIVEFVDELPRTLNGKVQRFALRAMASQRSPA
jgi:benzoate-CoA ligase